MRMLISMPEELHQEFLRLIPERRRSRHIATLLRRSLSRLGRSRPGEVAPTDEAPAPEDTRP